MSRSILIPFSLLGSIAPMKQRSGYGEAAAPRPRRPRGPPDRPAGSARLDAGATKEYPLLRGAWCIHTVRSQVDEMCLFEFF